jgi:hypothetical protein
MALIVRGIMMTCFWEYIFYWGPGPEDKFLVRRRKLSSVCSRNGITWNPETAE